MIKYSYPENPHRIIKVEGTNDELELIVWWNQDVSSALFELYINKKNVDHIECMPLVDNVNELGYLYGLEMMLYGSLREDVMVRVECKPGIYAKPEYAFYVGEQLIHKQLGDQGGL